MRLCGLLALPSPQMVSYCLPTIRPHIPKLFVNVEVDVFDDLADRGVVTEISWHGAYLPDVRCRCSRYRCNRFQVEQVRPVPRQHGSPAPSHAASATIPSSPARLPSSLSMTVVPQPNTLSAVNTASSGTNDSESAVWPGEWPTR